MGIISEVKCGRCDRRYSGFRSRCPYCGARRNKRGKHANETDNAKAKLVIGSLLMLVLIAAAMVLIISSLPDNDPEAAVTDPPAETSDDLPAYISDEGVVEVSGSPVTEEPEESESPSPEESEIPIESVAITYAGVSTTDFTLSHINDSIQLKYQTVPADTTAEAEWSGSDDSVFMFVENENGVKVTAIGSGVATLTVTVGGKTAECVVRVK